MPAENIGQMVIFRIGTVELALPVAEVREIIFVPPVTPLAKAPPSVAGLIHLRGDVIPVLDLGMEWFPQPVNSKKQRIVVARSRGRAVGLRVDEVNEVLGMDNVSLEPVPDAIATSQTAYISAICKADRRLILLLHLDRLVHELAMDVIMQPDYKEESIR